MGRAEQIIPQHLVENRTVYGRLIEKHFASVSRKATKQMLRVLAEPKNQFWSDIVWPNLLLDGQGQRRDRIDLTAVIEIPPNRRPIYVPISNTVRTMGRNHQLAELAFGADPASVQDQIAVFANALRIGCQNEQHEWEEPMLRVVGAPYTIFTFEFDPPSDWEHERRLEFLDTQLGWFRKVGTNDLDRPIRAVWDWAARFSDFRGICANWSGHKSVHIHLIFDTSVIMNELPEFRDQFRSAYTRLWSEMADGIARVFPQEIAPDSALRLPEQYRKLPNGVLVIDSPVDPKKRHLLGIPAGTRVPLLCVWEKLLVRAPAGSDRAFVNEAALRQCTGIGSPRQARYRRTSRIGDMISAEHEFCSERFNAAVAKRVGAGKFPKGAGLHCESSGWVGRLYANEFDRNPSTLIFEDNYRIFVQGGRQPDQSVSLPMPLGILIRQWRREYAQLRGLRLPGGMPQQSEEMLPQRPEERKFSEAATTLPTARLALGEFLADVLDRHIRILNRGPEGLGKTTAVAASLPDLTHRLTKAALEAIPVEDRVRRDAEWRRPSAFAFSSYELADEKAEDFNKSLAGLTHCGIVMPSFSRLYKECREALDAKEVVTPTLAAKCGHSSVMEAIKLRQPRVWAEMGWRHGRLFESVRGYGGRQKRVVYFVVHQVLQQAAANLLSAAFLHPRFFDTEPREWWRLRDEMRFQVAVHDEVPIEAIIGMHPGPQAEWCLNLFDMAREVWAEEDVGLIEKFRTFEAKMQHEPIPIAFEEVLDIHRAAYSQADQTEVAGCEPYGDGSLYADTHGRRWYARKRSWWMGLADRTILLTTEVLPTEMVRALRPGEGGFEVFDLRTSELRAGTIQMRLRPSCSSKDAVAIVQELRDEAADPLLEVITNRAAGVEHTSTHAGIRGSNRLTAQNVAQTAFYKPPGEYERLQIINRVFGLTSAIRLRHVDEINQSAGRNLGFRHDGLVEHHLVLGWSLYTEIESVLYSECRYDLTLVENADRRRKDKFAEQRVLNRDLLEQEEEIEGLAEMDAWEWQNQTGSEPDLGKPTLTQSFIRELSRGLSSGHFAGG